MAAASGSAAAQEVVCYPIRPGDTASAYALRLTGSPDNQYAPWFRIVDARGRIVPKSQHARIRPGWQVCVTRAAGRVHPVGIAVTATQAVVGVQPVEMAATVTGAPGRGQPVRVAATANRLAIDPMILRWAAAFLILVAALLAWLVAMRMIAEREAILKTMKWFGDAFVREFERPLVRQPVSRRIDRRDGHPVRSRLRFAPRRDRLEILLAPHDGRTYPNLSDHRKNLEYDVDRVLGHLGDRSFVSGRFYMEGRWVVIPFSLKAGVR